MVKIYGQRNQPIQVPEVFAGKFPLSCTFEVKESNYDSRKRGSGCIDPCRTVSSNGVDNLTRVARPYSGHVQLSGLIIKIVLTAGAQSPCSFYFTEDFENGD